MPDAPVVLGNAGHRALSERPHLAVLAMEAIASSSNVDSFLLKLFVKLLGGDTSLATRIYLKLEIRSAKSIALIEAIDSIEDARYAELARAIVALSKSNQKDRDKLAHHVWGISPRLPDALLLLDPKTMTESALDRDAIYVYKADDFGDIIAANDRLCGYTLNLLFILSGHGSNRGDALYNQLCKEPEIRERLDRQA